jgi:hypothetical protein
VILRIRSYPSLYVICQVGSDWQSKTQRLTTPWLLIKKIYSIPLKCEANQEINRNFSHSFCKLHHFIEENKILIVIKHFSLIKQLHISKFQTSPHMSFQIKLIMNGQNGNGTNSKYLVPTQTFWNPKMSIDLRYNTLQHFILWQWRNIIHLSTAKYIVKCQIFGSKKGLKNLFSLNGSTRFEK